MAWQIDPSHSSVEFSVRHMMISTVRGRFHEFSGTVEGDEANPNLASIAVSIVANSIDTRDAKRDEHLRSPDFLNIAEYPEVTFTSTSIEKLGDDNAKMHGNLTIRGVTRPVTLDVTYNGTAKAPWGTVSAGFSASTKVSRKDWGLTWNMALETGGVVVGDDVKIDIEVELVQVAEQPAEATA
jgi:polyisoprenoid-binding protein YceI